MLNNTPVPLSRGNQFVLSMTFFRMVNSFDMTCLYLIYTLFHMGFFRYSNNVLVMTYLIMFDDFSPSILSYLVYKMTNLSYSFIDPCMYMSLSSLACRFFECSFLCSCCILARSTSRLLVGRFLCNFLSFFLRYSLYRVIFYHFQQFRDKLRCIFFSKVTLGVQLIILSTKQFITHCPFHSVFIFICNIGYITVFVQVLCCTLSNIDLQYILSHRHKDLSCLLSCYGSITIKF